MYEKMLHGRRILHFRFAPPVTNLDDTSTRDTQPPFDGAPGYMWSVYYYWWAFLRLSKPYKECCENGCAGELSDLYTYFGDVRDDDFMHWWKSGGHPQGSKNRIHSGRKIFSHGIRFPIREIHDPLLDKEGEDNRVVLSVPVGTDLSQMTAEFQQLMRPLVEARRRDCDERMREALFEVTSKNPTLRSLHKIYTALETKQRRSDLTPYQLAKELGITAKLSGDENDQDHKMAALTELNRLLKKAEVLVRNVERGRFPDHTDYKKKGKEPEPPRALRPKSVKRTEQVVVVAGEEELSLF